MRFMHQSWSAGVYAQSVAPGYTSGTSVHDKREQRVYRGYQNQPRPSQAEFRNRNRLGSVVCHFREGVHDEVGIEAGTAIGLPRFSTKELETNNAEN